MSKITNDGALCRMFHTRYKGDSGVSSSLDCLRASGTWTVGLSGRLFVLVSTFYIFVSGYMW